MLGVTQHWFMARAEHSPNLMGPSCHHSAGHSMGYAPLDVIPVQGLGLSRSLSESSTYKYFIAIRPQTDLSPVACLWHFFYYIDWEGFPMFWYLDWDSLTSFLVSGLPRSPTWARHTRNRTFRDNQNNATPWIFKNITSWYDKWVIINDNNCDLRSPLRS